MQCHEQKWMSIQPSYPLLHLVVMLLHLGRPRAHATGQSSLLDPQAWVRTPSGFLIPRTAAESASAPADVIPEDHGPVQLATVWQQVATPHTSIYAACFPCSLLM